MDPWGTHLPVLMAACSATAGPILECGAGDYSTPILHALCAPQRRPLVTLESKPDWLARFANLEAPWHALTLVSDWNAVDLDDHYDVALVDHGCEPRGPLLYRLHRRASLVVLHDSECNYCGYRDPLTRFDWAWTHKQESTWTTLAGMGERPAWVESIGVGEWGIPVPYRG
jgi:hypothetical protein